MNKEVEKLIQVWVDWKFGIPNQFNTKLLLDFLKFAEEKLGYLPVEEAHLEVLGDEEGLLTDHQDNIPFHSDTTSCSKEQSDVLRFFLQIPAIISPCFFLNPLSSFHSCKQ